MSKHSALALHVNFLKIWLQRQQMQSLLLMLHNNCSRLAWQSSKASYTIRHVMTTTRQYLLFEKCTTSLYAAHVKSLPQPWLLPSTHIHCTEPSLLLARLQQCQSSAKCCSLCRTPDTPARSDARAERSAALR